jgi:hypothetical protein
MNGKRNILTLRVISALEALCQCVVKKKGIGESEKGIGDLSGDGSELVACPDKKVFENGPT